MDWFSDLREFMADDPQNEKATVKAHEEFELMTDAFDEIKVHLRVVEIVAAHPGRLLYDSSIELLAQIITVLGVVMQMRREKYAGQAQRLSFSPLG